MAGHSGSGKSSIIQHIALKYRKEGWVVKPVDTIEEIKEAYVSGNFKENKTVFVFDDPIGKESYNEILHNSWKKYEKTLKLFLKKVKLLLTCRTWILSDKKVQGLFIQKENIVVIDDKENKLSNEEKYQIFKMQNSNADVTENDLAEILKTETYFPLLCKLYASNNQSFEHDFTLFTEPKEVAKKEIEFWKEEDTKKYCSLICLVLFNNTFCLTDCTTNVELFKKCLNLCGLPDCTAPSTLKANLEQLVGFFVKKIGDNYHFYHDFIMEVTTLVFGKDYPAETIRYADIGFLRRRVTLGNCKDSNDSFVINVNDTQINNFVERFLNEIVGDRFMEVVLNPCLKYEKLTDLLIEKLGNDVEKVQMLLKFKKIENTEPQSKLTLENYICMSRLDLVNIIEEISPLFALIVFCHDKLSLFCLKKLREIEANMDINSILFAVCVNGSTEIFNTFSKEEIEIGLNTSMFDGFNMIHLAAMYHNHELIERLLCFDIDANMKSEENEINAPLYYAIFNVNLIDLKLEKIGKRSSLDETVITLINNGADVNILDTDGDSPLMIVCSIGHESTLQILLEKGANVNLCNKTGVSPLYAACSSGHDSTIQLLLNNGADVNLCDETGVSPLYAACSSGHDSTIQLLLNNGANKNLCDNQGKSPVYVACENGNDSTLQLLIQNGADVDLCDEDGTSPLHVSCFVGFGKNVQLLLNNGAKVNKNTNRGYSPLYISCETGNDSIVKLLLNKGAEVDLLDESEINPFYIASKNNYDSIVELLLNHYTGNTIKKT